MGCCLLVPAKVADGGILSAGPPPPVKARWRKQITALKGEGEEGEVSHVAKFKTHEEWKACFEPKKEKKKKEEEREKSEEERTRDKENREKAQKALNHLLDKVGHKITDKIVYLVLTFVAKLMEGAEKIALEKGDEEIAGLANALGALVCTFIFKHKGKHKFKFIRREMVAPELYKRINVLFDRIDAGKAEDAADKLALKVSALLKGEDAIARAVAAVSEMPLVVKLQQKMLESKGKSREEVEVSEEDIDKEMNNVLIMVGARLQAATSGQGTLSDYATCIIGVLLGGIQNTMRGSSIVERLCLEVNKVIKACILSIEVATAAKGAAENVKATIQGERQAADLWKDAELRYENLQHFVQKKVDDTLTFVKETILSSADEGDDQDDTET